MSIAVIAGNLAFPPFLAVPQAVLGSTCQRMTCRARCGTAILVAAPQRISWPEPIVFSLHRATLPLVAASFSLGHLTLRTRIKRLVRTTICCSTSTQMHAMVLGLFVHRSAFGLRVSSGHLHCENTTPHSPGFRGNACSPPSIRLISQYVALTMSHLHQWPSPQRVRHETPRQGDPPQSHHHR